MWVAALWLINTFLHGVANACMFHRGGFGIHSHSNADMYTHNSQSEVAALEQHEAL